MRHTGGHFEDLLLGRVPGDDVELLNLGLAQKTAGASTEDGGRGVGVQGWGSESLRCLGGLGLRGGHAHSGAIAHCRQLLSLKYIKTTISSKT